MNFLRLALRIIAVFSIALVGIQLVTAAGNIETPDNDAVRLAGLGLPLLFLAFLNLIVWGQDFPRRSTRTYTHVSNGLMLIASLLVVRAISVTFSYAVAGCTILLAMISLLLEIKAVRAGGMVK